MSKPATHAVEESAASVIERQIESAEGPYHVEGRHYANPDDAARQRRIVAERRVREASRRAEWTARTAALAPLPRPRLSTWLTARERAQVDAAAGACLVLEHRESLAGVGCDVGRGWADAALVSAALVRADDSPALARYVRGYPGVAFAGLVTDAADPRQALAAAHTFGHAGVGALLDCRGADGWAALRGTFAPRHLPDAFLRACVAGVLADVRGEDDGGIVAEGLVRFFAAVFAPDVTEARDVAAQIGAHPTTLTSRFFRAGLPSPRRYVGCARLVWAARIGETPALSLSTIANRVDASSPQAYRRTVRATTGLSASEFRRRFTGAGMLERFRATLVTPYRDTLRTFDPTGGDPPPSPARMPVRITTAAPQSTPSRRAA